MAVSEKEKMTFKSLDWMMSEFDLKDFCQRVDWKIDHTTNEHVVTFCPDHFQFTGRIPSHPKFYIDRKSGKCQCKTESRGSNLIWTVQRVFKINSLTEAYKFIVGKEIEDLDTLNWALLTRKLQGATYKRPNLENEEEEDYVKLLVEVEERIQEPYVAPDGYEFFKNPINGKKATNINPETVNYFKVYQQSEGYYKNRVIVPIFLNTKVTGFVAIDILGKEQWLKNNPLKVEDDYKKLLYPKHFKSRNNLFNYDNVEAGASFIILVEGVRDAMKLWQMGYRNVCALLGTNISDRQRELISLKYPDKCYIMLDGDDAGYLAARKIAKKVGANIDARVALVPRGHDPKTVPQESIPRILDKAVPVN